MVIHHAVLAHHLPGWKAGITLPGKYISVSFGMKDGNGGSKQLVLIEHHRCQSDVTPRSGGIFLEYRCIENKAGLSIRLSQRNVHHTMFIIFVIGRCHRLIHSLLYRRRYQRPTGINLPLSIGGSPDDGIHIRPHQIGCGKIKIMDNPS